MQWSDRPVILLGHGARGADLTPLFALGVPILTSWQAKDLIDNNHHLYFGSPGIYGQRTANLVLHHANMILAIGNRMSVWCVGYDGPREDQRVVMVDVDGHEVSKFKAEWIKMDARKFIAELDEKPGCENWLAWCAGHRMPWIEDAHEDGDYINSYRFVDALHQFLLPDSIIVTDMGTPHICAHQVLKLKPPQRLMSSGGLGEMGCGLPAAVGASFARDKGPVLCMIGDGGAMLNLQELATIVHHKLPIRIIVFANDGYAMIRATQRKAGQKYVAVDKASGVSMPSFRKLAHAWGMMACDVRNWRDFDSAMPLLFSATEPALVEYWMDPDQPMVPKLDPVYVNGLPTSPRFDQLSPIL